MENFQQHSALTQISVRVIMKAGKHLSPRTYIFQNYNPPQFYLMHLLIFFKTWITYFGNALKYQCTQVNCKSDYTEHPGGMNMNNNVCQLTVDH